MLQGVLDYKGFIYKGFRVDNVMDLVYVTRGWGLRYKGFTRGWGLDYQGFIDKGFRV